jgi:hypothetical protein
MRQRNEQAHKEGWKSKTTKLLYINLVGLTKLLRAFRLAPEGTILAILAARSVDNNTRLVFSSLSNYNSSHPWAFILKMMMAEFRL